MEFRDIQYLDVMNRFFMDLTGRAAIKKAKKQVARSRGRDYTFDRVILVERPRSPKAGRWAHCQALHMHAARTEGRKVWNCG